ncbi:hypothetical protein D3C71_1247840 [compost metagenome]
MVLGGHCDTRPVWAEAQSVVERRGEQDRQHAVLPRQADHGQGEVFGGVDLAVSIEELIAPGGVVGGKVVALVQGQQQGVRPSWQSWPVDAADGAPLERHLQRIAHQCGAHFGRRTPLPTAGVAGLHQR